MPAVIVKHTSSTVRLTHHSSIITYTARAKSYQKEASSLNWLAAVENQCVAARTDRLCRDRAACCGDYPLALVNNGASRLMTSRPPWRLMMTNLLAHSTMMTQPTHVPAWHSSRTTVAAPPIEASQIGSRAVTTSNRTWPICTAGQMWPSVYVTSL